MACGDRAASPSAGAGHPHRRSPRRRRAWEWTAEICTLQTLEPKEGLSARSRKKNSRSRKSQAGDGKRNGHPETLPLHKSEAGMCTSSPPARFIGRRGNPLTLVSSGVLVPASSCFSSVAVGASLSAALGESVSLRSRSCWGLKTPSSGGPLTVLGCREYFFWIAYSRSGCTPGASLGRSSNYWPDTDPKN
ncbi:hypothetical protein NDU88_004890 [Pleurodeles waltl]|uniref:Uncharacterized protein n=1 Tax=Pleurodeles waltl TaxID=8319 RepID=A0AAV7UGG5_PLEWA|nr:hypothetical protein NDU88_004890 [Pleurodeles waltl]